MNDDMYRQCELKNTKTGGQHVAWIKAKLAVKGNTVSFTDEPDDDRFAVLDVFPGSLPWEKVNDRGQDYKRTRKASDI